MSGKESNDDDEAALAPTKDDVESRPAMGGQSRPILHIGSSAMTAVELSQLSAGGSGLSWTPPARLGGADLCASSSDDGSSSAETVLHAPLSDAPSAAALAVAEALLAALDGATLPASESDTEGRVFVVANIGAVAPSDDNDQVRDTCLAALGIRAEAWAEATFVQRDWSSMPQGFCYSADEFDDDVDDDDDDEENDDDSDRSKIIRATRILSDELVADTGFELNFSEEIVCGPVLYGGFVQEGNGFTIVGVLSMRVWT